MYFVSSWTKAVRTSFGIFFAFPLPSFVPTSLSVSLYGQVRAFEHVVDCFFSRDALWALVEACDMVSHVTDQEPSMHYFTGLHLFGIW